MLARKQSFVVSTVVRSKNSVLDKKIPENPKFKNVKPVVDTGYSVRKYIDTLKRNQRNSTVKNDEIFSRIRLSAFVKIAVDVAIAQQPKTGVKGTGAEVNGGGGEDEPSESSNIGAEISKNPSNESKISANATLPFTSVITGIGEMSLLKEHKKSSTAPSSLVVTRSRPYLLLDVRDKEDYMQCHIITARSYPFTMLCRTINYDIGDLRSFKNKDGKIIVLYDEEDSLAARVATTLIQRGYDNVFVLSGGLRLAYQKFPRGLIHGTIPFSLLSIKKRKEIMRSNPVEIPKCIPKDKFSPEDIEILKTFVDGFFGTNSPSLEPSTEVLLTDNYLLNVLNHRKEKVHVLSEPVISSTAKYIYKPRKTTKLKSVKKPPWK